MDVTEFPLDRLDREQPSQVDSNVYSLPAGRYWVGDLCYVIGDEGDRVWEDFIANEHWNGRDVAACLAGHPTVALNTAYGDGAYTSTTGEVFGVDAGVIGVAAWELTDPEGRNLGHEHTFEEEFLVYRDRWGTIYIGELEIPTGD